jgi:hypothetical protein
MNRYANINKQSRWDGKKVLNTTHYPNIPVSDDDIFIVSNETDYLDTLAFKYYNDSSLWWIIALVNNISHGRLSVEAGLQLRIPTNLTNILADYDRENS